MSVDHYENFPVASLLVPARLRPAVEAIYRWARTADDLADEGEVPDAQRLTALARMKADLDRIAAGQAPDEAVAAALAPVIGQHRLALAPFHDLLSAFAQDVQVKRYADRAQLHDYCRRSANPVGRLMLALYDAQTPQHLAWSDAICTGLQLTNFWQDVAQDWARGRVYLPQADLARHAVSEARLAAFAEGAALDAAWCALLADEVAHARALLREGAPLARAIGGRIGWELRLVTQGGLRILERIEEAGYDVFRARPKLDARDWALMSLRALRA